MPHGYLNFPGLCRLADQALAEITAEQQGALAGTVTAPAKPTPAREPGH